VTRVAVVGGGILGLAAAAQVQRIAPGAAVTVYEKEAAVARHQTGHNSGVVHAGLYYEPGSLKARLCRRGAGLLRDLCLERGLPYEECGKVVVATREAELPALPALLGRARANGVPGVRIVDAGELRALEPHVRGLAALHSPTTAITDYGAVARELARAMVAAGATVATGVEVVRLDTVGDVVDVTLGDGARATFDHAIVCAGLQSDLLATRSGEPVSPGIVPFRGEYRRLRDHRRHLVSGLIYPVPEPGLPFLGVHLTKNVDGSVWMGPNAVLALAREGYRWRDVSLRDLRRIVATPGARRMFARHWRVGVDEVAGSISRRVSVRRAREYVPALRAADFEGARAGVRAQALDADGTLVDDFRLSAAGRTVWVRNAPSPAATSSLAIAEELVARLAL
jgi:L-2-hydroxyglutarate oxidase